jgi:hypothetical protein
LNGILANKAEFWQMKIKSLHLKNFKRFTDLTLQGIPENAKLVLLIGSNGSGKSSVFDGLEVLNRYKVGHFSDNDNYYRKDKGPFRILADYGDGFLLDTDIKVHKGNNLKLAGDVYYGRTSFRQIPRLTRLQLGTNFNINADSDRPYSFIDRDERFENDLEHIFGKLLKEFFKSDEEKFEIKESVISPINAALTRIFSKENGTKLELIELIPPLEGKVAEVNFKKGNSIFHYNQLSAGEKEIFSILINFVARKDIFKGTLYFDEIDLHLNTKLQYNFLKELAENWIPDRCQFWTASHSLGFIQYAKESEQAVVFDFDDYDFDRSKILVPEPKDSSDLYEIAVSREILPFLFKDYSIFFVENKDKNYYSSLVLPHILFVQATNKKAVYHKTKNGEFFGIVDRDFLTDEDIRLIEKQYPKLKILRLYSIENYLYHPDNLEEYYSTRKEAYKKKDYELSLFNEKNSAANEIKRKLALVRMSYPFFEEPEFNGKSNQKRFRNDSENLDQVKELEEYLNSPEFDVFYKVFPMKDYATQLKERQNINKSDLSKTEWFKTQIEDLLK